MFPNTEANLTIAKRIFLKNLDEANYFPKYFEIETVNACNARCTMCTINDWDKRQDVILPMPLFSKFVDEVSKYSNWVETVCLNRDGEPTLDKHLSERVRMLKKAGIKKVTFASNAQKLVPALSKELIEAGLDDIMLSIDGVTKEVFEKIRIRLNFETVVGNVLELIKLRNEMNPKMTIRIRMVLVDSNKHELDEWMAFWKSKIGPNDKLYAKPAHSWGNQLHAEAESKIAYFADKPCVSVFSSLVMHSDGMIGICGVDYNVKQPMGDFKKQSVQEIWQGEGFIKVRELHATKRRNEIPMCRGCDIWDREVID
jgi:sulfatase maturation enzyme AslB (radical SAM superfamily)